MTKLINKKQEIKNRIDLINKGEVPEGYKKEHGYIVPNDWQIKPIKYILEQIKRPKEKPNEPYYRLSVRSHAKGTFHSFVENPKEVAMEELFEVKENDLIVNITFAWEHAIAIVKKEDDGLLVSHRFPTYEFNNNANVTFYENIIKFPKIKKMLGEMSPGGAGRNRVLNQNDFYNKLYVPYTSKREQEKIAEILDCCDKVIELKQKLIDEKQKQKRYLMQNLFDKITNYKKLSDIALIIMGQSPNSKKYNSIQRGIPLIQGNADCKLRQTCPKLYTTEITKKCLINDIIMSVRAPVGAISKSVHNACIGRGVCAIRPFQNSNYVYQYLLHIENKWNKLIQGSTFESINSNDIKNTLIPYPDCKTQQRIERILSRADKEIKLLEQELEQYKQLKKSLSQLLLTGIVRVNEV
ncbi:MAG: restriction endonuclease subunit S [Candidatus Gastranaerophilales bacterium]|nr:restriction endonuclease subunit S [Candidatus Gastranaerophilales bacterium]